MLGYKRLRNFEVGAFYEANAVVFDANEQQVVSDDKILRTCCLLIAIQSDYPGSPPQVPGRYRLRVAWRTVTTAYALGLKRRRP